MDYEKIKQYWNERAEKYGNSPQSTTEDYYLREIEIRELTNEIKNLNNVRNALDIGCGDGYTTIEVAKKFPNISFVGLDYSDKMIKNAKNRLRTEKIMNIRFFVSDITKANIKEKYDLIYTTRCLINLNNIKLQYKILNKIFMTLNKDGIYIMIENFLDGHNEFNNLRKQFDLPMIDIRNHNLFFKENELKTNLESNFKFLSSKNISSLYYIVSRIVYSKICKLENKEPDYYDIHHNIASKLPMCGNFGPVKLIVLEKKS